MHTSRTLTRFGLAAGLLLAVAPVPGQTGLVNRVFVSARSGNNANACDSLSLPCQTLAGAVPKLNPGGEAIVLDSGGYGPVTITQAVTIEAAPGVTAFIHPPSGNAVTVNAPGATVTLRGLVLNAGTGNGVEVVAVGTLSVESCSITGFDSGIHMGASGHLIVKHTDVKSCTAGIYLSNGSGVAYTSIDHCHLDANAYGLLSQTISPAESVTTATNSTANGNSQVGWASGSFTSGADVLHLESCSGSDNAVDGVRSASTAVTALVTLSNCVFAQDQGNAVNNAGSGRVQSRGNNTVLGATSGVVDSFNPF